jgi:hypothetical protein
MLKKILAFLRAYRGWLISAAFCVAAIVIVGGSSSFTDCVDDQHYQARYKPQQNNSSSVPVFVSEWSECTGHFVHDNGEAIIALFTVVLAISTILLWGATRNLMISAESTSKRQLRAYLGIDAGAATIRGEQVEFWVNVRNRGQTPAYDVARFPRADIIDPQGTGDVSFPTPPREDGRWMIVPGAYWTPRAWLKLIDVEAARFDESLGAHFWGRIEYTDTAGDPHWMTFRYQLGGEIAGDRGERVGWTLEVTEDGNDADRD